MGKLKINKSALNRAIDSAADKATQKLISAGDKAQKEIRKKYTENWFLNKSDTMSSALQYKHRIRKHHDKTVISFNSYVDMGSFSANVLANDRCLIFDISALEMISMPWIFSKFATSPFIAVRFAE